MEADETVGARIETLAKAKGLPEGQALAAEFGVSYETLRKWREGQSAPNRKRAILIGEKLGVAPESFMYGVASGEHDVPAHAKPPSLASAVAVVARWLSERDEMTREMAAPLLTRLAHAPSDGAAIAQRLEQLLATASARPPPPTEVRPDAQESPGAAVFQLPAGDRRGSGYRQITSPWSQKKHPHRRKDDKGTK